MLIQARSFRVLKLVIHCRLASFEHVTLTIGIPSSGSLPIDTRLASTIRDLTYVNILPFPKIIIAWKAFLICEVRSKSISKGSSADSLIKRNNALRSMISASSNSTSTSSSPSASPSSCLSHRSLANAAGFCARSTFRSAIILRMDSAFFAARLASFTAWTLASSGT